MRSFLWIKGSKRIVACLLLLVIVFSSFVSCEARALPTTREDTAVVGTVGEYEVLYEELRFLVHSHKADFEIKYGKGIWDDPTTAAEYLPALKELVYEDILVNYAVLSLAEKDGILLDSYDEAVQTYMETVLAVDFGGDRSAYKQFLEGAELTDHYVRFTAGVDKVYEDLYYKYLEDGRIEDGEDAVRQYILQNFVYVASICLINKSDEEYDSNRERAEQYREAVVNGADIMDYVKYTLDLSPLHCFTRGEMDKVYEDAAFALEQEGDVSEVFLGSADYLGGTNSAWYFLQRLPLTAEYVDENYASLFDQYTAAAMNDYLNAEKKTLSFVPNEYGESLDLLSIEPIERTKDNTWIFVLIGVVGSAAVIGGVVLLVLHLNRKPVRGKNEKARAVGKR